MVKSKEIFVSHKTFLSRAFDVKNALVLIVLAFGLLTLFAKQYAYFSFDLQITLFIQRINFPFFDSLMRYLTYLGNPEIAVISVALVALVVYFMKAKAASLMTIISCLGGLLVSVFFKMIVSRPRPDPLLIHQVGTFLHTDSFPSGHVLGAVSLYGFVLYIAYTRLQNTIIRRLIITVCSFIIILMGVSRIYLGAHWFSDVLGAYLIGFVWLSIMVFFYHKIHSKLLEKSL
jgi:membrane-associated phospholipid phosphatase